LRKDWQLLGSDDDPVVQEALAASRASK